MASAIPFDVHTSFPVGFGQPSCEFTVSFTSNTPFGVSFWQHFYARTFTILSFYLVRLEGLQRTTRWDRHRRRMCWLKSRPRWKSKSRPTSSVCSRSVVCEINRCFDSPAAVTRLVMKSNSTPSRTRCCYVSKWRCCCYLLSSRRPPKRPTSCLHTPR